MNPTILDSRHLEKILRSDFGLQEHQHILVAFSGGLDSTVLLHALACIDSIRNERITALHVNHRLNRAAGLWVRHCEKKCREWGVEFRSHRAEARDPSGHGTEAMARDVRYEWFSGQITSDSVLLTAHHFNDHVETVMAAFFRGSGVRGLAGIRAARPFGEGRLWRPLLQVTRSDLAKYAVAHDLDWIEDPMNANVNFTRNHLRHRVLPLVRDKWPGVDKVIARSADNWLDASDLLDEIAGSDLAAVHQRSEAMSHMLSIPDLRRYSRLRVANALRLWFVQCGFGTPTRRRLREVMESLIDGAPKPTCVVCWPGTEVRRYRGWLYLSATRRRQDFQSLVWNGYGQQPVQLSGRVITTRDSTGNGIRKSICDSQRVSIRPRKGGERCHIPGSGCHKKLKKIFQEKGIPPWLRDDYPLLYIGEDLAGVVGICYCEPFAAQNSETGVVFDLIDANGGGQKVQDPFP